MLLPETLAQVLLQKQPAQAGSQDLATPGGTAWRISCQLQPSVMAEIPGE